MKSVIAGFELKYLIDEIKIVEGGKINKIFEPETKHLLLDLHIPSYGKKLLKIVAGKYICFTYDKEDMTDPSSFCMYLRKQLSNSRIVSIAQIGCERIVEIKLETFEENTLSTKYLFLEFYGKGNIILCDQDKIILNLSEVQKFSDRIVQRGTKYEPQLGKYNYFELKKTDLKNLFGYTTQNLVKALAADLGMGGTYAEEVCFISGVDKNKNGVEVDEKELEKIQQTIITITTKEKKPSVIFDGEVIKDVIPITLEIMKEFRTEPYETYSEAVEAFFNLRENVKADDSRLQSYNERLKKLQTIIDAQQKISDQNINTQKDLQNKGNKIYEHYGTVEEILKDLKDLNKIKDADKLNEKVNRYNMIKKVTKEGLITLELT